MDSRLCALMASGGGVCTWREMVRVAPEWTVQATCRAGRLVRALPGVYLDATLLSHPGTETPVLARVEPELARRAALAYADGRGALCRLTALDVWGLPPATRRAGVRRRTDRLGSA
ncbi:hypothetical protein ACLQ25_13050 [Micromonospora sp. DT44]|uniref:hypothetical protein n=1 Tax=Micromonospora sp. DT44 TaxID=3393439 RepID=UPI003CE99CCB